MTFPLILASESPIRAILLTRAGIDFRTEPARLDEESLQRALLAEGRMPRDIADSLAEAKARRVSLRHPEALVIGADQILDLDGEMLPPPADTDAARSQLLRLRGRAHRLHSAVTIVRGGTPLWRHVADAVLTMRAFSEETLDRCLAAEGGAPALTPGGYRFEGPHVRLFARTEGDLHTILGLPLLQLVSQLVVMGVIAE